jgi:NAD(P)-dependent dehydrogenase (short-subunit alcohol dehydrogenase family)
MCGKTAALEVGRDLGVAKHDPAREESIVSEPGALPVDEQLVALRVGVVGDLELDFVGTGHDFILVLFAGIRTIERERVDVTGKKAMVVGGASGMGRATAELLHERGASIAILDLESSAGKDVAATLGGSFHACDVTDDEGAEMAITDAVATLGRLHIAVNTAGGGIAKRTLSKQGPHPLDDFRRVVDLNLIATFNLNRLQAWHMSQNDPDDDGERGVMINTASIAAFEGQIGQVAYSAAKAGIAGMMLTMARDLGGVGVRVVAIAPSLFSTGITAGIPDEMAAQLTRDAAFPKRMGEPGEYARLALAIAENAMLNGSTIRLDGGQRFSPK